MPPDPELLIIVRTVEAERRRVRRLVAWSSCAAAGFVVAVLAPSPLPLIWH